MGFLQHGLEGLHVYKLSKRGEILTWIMNVVVKKQTLTEFV